jgi:catechol 2,3-dioxygenase-like lactoylglutathione lyase family enzyme
MAVLRIVANLAAEKPKELATFYQTLLDLDIVMDLDWIVTFAGSTAAMPQISAASQGGSGTEVPDLSIEVDDLQAVLDRAEGMGLTLVYGPVLEPWGVRRFYVRDPSGKLLNILEHVDTKKQENQ